MYTSISFIPFGRIRLGGGGGKLGLHRLDGNCGAPRIHGVTINAAFLIEYAHQPHRGATVMGADTLTITDDRTGNKYTLQIENGAIRASDLRSIKLSDDDFGLMSYDPAFSNTASTKSAITFIDGDKGILRYRGYPIEQLAEQSTFMETSYLIINGELPTNDQLEDWTYNVTHHSLLQENAKKFMEGFRYDAHPMAMLLSTVGALSSFYPDAKDVYDADSRMLQIYRAIAKMPTIAAFAYRHSLGFPYIYPNNAMTYSCNFLNMLFRPLTDQQYLPHPALEKAVDVLFILHADHEQNASANVMRSIGSAQTDPFACLSGAIAALYGPLHGGANEAVVRMLTRIGAKDNVPAMIKRVKNREELLMGFGHRVYNNYDPRASVIKRIAEDVFEVVPRSPLLDVALELERIALEDEFFVSRKLYPNVDFYSGLIYQAIGLPTEMFPVMFAIPRTVGWLAQWQEMVTDPEQRISRPRQVYTGKCQRQYVRLEERE